MPSLKGLSPGRALLLRMCSALILSASSGAAAGAAAAAEACRGAAGAGAFSAGDEGRIPAAVTVVNEAMLMLADKAVMQVKAMQQYAHQQNPSPHTAVFVMLYRHA